MKLKGISPLIAAVLLIAFTMAIAGILAIWATTFSQTRLQTAGECPALAVQDLSFNSANGNVTLRLLNTNKNTQQSGIKVSVLYPDGDNAESVDFGTGTLAALAVRTEVIDAEAETTAHTESDAPTKIEIITTNCPTTPVTAIIP